MQTERSSAWLDMSFLKLADVLLHSLMNTSTGAAIPVNPFLREVHLKSAKLKKNSVHTSYKTPWLCEKDKSVKTYEGNGQYLFL
jgi:hypothetical protein